MTFLIIMVLSVFSCNVETPTRFSEEALNDTFISLDDEVLTFETILEKYKGKQIVIDVWASWCKDCVRGFSKLKQLQEEKDDVVYLFLSLDRSIDKWKRGIDKYNIEGEHYYMQSGWKGPFGKFLDLDWVPRYLVVDAQGNIKLFRAVKADDKRIRERL